MSMRPATEAEMNLPADTAAVLASCTKGNSNDSFVTVLISQMKSEYHVIHYK